MARIGTFQGPSIPFGAATGTVQPPDNNITPDPAQAAADQLAADAAQLLDDINNAVRNNLPPPTLP